MKKGFFSSKGKGNGVNTKNRCMGCIGDCESCSFKNAVEKPTFEDFLEDSDWDRFEAMANEFEKRLEAGEVGEKKEKAPVLCKPYLVSIGAIYREYSCDTDQIIFRLDIDEKGKVIKEPWSPHGTNLDNRLDSLVFGYALHHLTPDYKGRLMVVEHAFELVQGEEEENVPYDREIIYPVGPNFMAKNIKVDCAAAAATVRQMETSRENKKWVMAVYEIMERNLLNDTEYFIGLPTSDLPAREV